MKRRHFLTLSASTIGGVLVYSLDRKASRISAQGAPVRMPLRFFDAREALIVAAAASRIFPSDESGPGANEAGVVIYIDRQLAGPYGRDRHRYTHPPFESGPPELGYQGKATPREIYRDALSTMSGFDRLEPAKQDEFLKRMESSHFFSLLRQHTIEGMFCDPIHGGNANMIGWQLVGFPGPHMSYYDDVDKHFGVAFRPKLVSLPEGHPSEDEG
ncbi:MAG: gluconate 2-dehydrogenase subunit 3 family protein [Terriglobia bacterium]